MATLLFPDVNHGRPVDSSCLLYEYCTKTQKRVTLYPLIFPVFYRAKVTAGHRCPEPGSSKPGLSQVISQLEELRLLLIDSAINIHDNTTSNLTIQ
jgi:hypothetical protein